jgi:hypothetical protein
MKPKEDPSQLSAESISRRVALGRVVVAGLGLAALPAQAAAPTVPVPIAEKEFVPENDYPYFGFEPPNE